MSAPATALAMAELRALLDDVYARMDAVEKGLRFSGHQPGYNAQGHGAHGHWLPGEGGGLHAEDGAGGHIHVEKAASGGYHVHHTSATGETIHDEHHSSLASVNKYAGKGEKLTGAHFKGEGAQASKPPDEAKLSTLRGRLDERMSQREELYHQQNKLLEEKRNLELNMQSKDPLEMARYRAKIDLYHQSLDQSDPVVKRYLKYVAAYKQARIDSAAARTEQQRLEQKMNVLAAKGLEHSEEFAQAKADYHAAVKREQDARKAEEKSHGDLWSKTPGVYVPEMDSIAGFDYHTSHEVYGTDAKGFFRIARVSQFKPEDVENHPIVARARAAQKELPARLAEVNRQLGEIDQSIKTSNRLINGDLGRLRAINATRGTAGEGGKALDTLRPFSDVLELPEGHQAPNALMQKLDYQMREPRAVTKARIIDNIAKRLEGNPAWEEYVARMPLPGHLGVYHGYVHVDADAKDAKSLKLTADLIRSWGIGYKSGSQNWVALQMAVHDEFGLTAHIHGMSEEQLKIGRAFYEKNGAAYRAFTRAMYENTQQWFSERGISEVNLYRGFHWKEGDPALPHDVRWGESEQQNHGIHDIELNPFQSFSADINISQGTANMQGWGGGFAQAGRDDYTLLIGAKVPVDRILSTAQTGFGAKLESEVVVMGREHDTVAFRAGTRVESALSHRATEESHGAGHRSYRLEDGTSVHVRSHGDGTHTITYDAGPKTKLGGLKVGDSKVYKTEKGINAQLRRMRIANEFTAPEDMP